MSSYFSKTFERGISWVAAAAIVAQPQLLLADGVQVNQPVAVRSAAEAVAPQDVALAEGGVLTGQVVTTAGKPQAMVPVSLTTGGKEIARATTDKNGQFRVASLKGGVYQVSTAGNSGVYRFWAPRTAPPSSLNGLNMVSGNQMIVRGQMGGGPLASAGQWIAEHPIITAGAIATAIAVPLALDDDDDPSSP
jgi:hypothetical protein